MYNMYNVHVDTFSLLGLIQILACHKSLDVHVHVHAMYDWTVLSARYGGGGGGGESSLARKSGSSVACNSLGLYM